MESPKRRNCRTLLLTIVCFAVLCWRKIEVWLSWKFKFSLTCNWKFIQGRPVNEIQKELRSFFTQDTLPLRPTYHLPLTTTTPTLYPLPCTYYHSPLLLTTTAPTTYYHSPYYLLPQPPLSTTYHFLPLPSPFARYRLLPQPPSFTPYHLLPLLTPLFWSHFTHNAHSRSE